MQPISSVYTDRIRNSKRSPDERSDIRGYSFAVIPHIALLMRATRSASALVTPTETAFEIVKVGFEQFVATSARQNGFIDGLVTMAMMNGLDGLDRVPQGLSSPKSAHATYPAIPARPILPWRAPSLTARMTTRERNP